MNLRQMIRHAGLALNLSGLAIALSTEAPGREAVGVILALVGIFAILEADGLANAIRRI